MDKQQIEAIRKRMPSYDRPCKSELLTPYGTAMQDATALLKAYDALAARLAEAERDRDMWHARAISLFWNPGEETTCAAVRTDADLAMEWIKSGNKASDCASVEGE